MCFVSSWELSLVVVPAFPLIFLSHRLGHKLLYSSGSGDGDCLEVSTHLVTETVSNIKTVVSLEARDYFVESISLYLHSHMLCVNFSLYAKLLTTHSYPSYNYTGRVSESRFFKDLRWLSCWGWFQWCMLQAGDWPLF